MTRQIAGVDEAGRGPLAGPVVAAAVILNPKVKIEGLADSKLLTEKKREALYTLIVENCVWAVGKADIEEIDSINILRAALLAMRRAVLGLAIEPHQVKVDGNICPDIPFPVKAYVAGDQYISEISAASIIAKVTRDREMMSYDALYPEYGFASNKGYATPFHLNQLKRLGPTPIHRRSFDPVKQMLLQKELFIEEP